MKKHAYGLLAAAILTIVATAAFALEAQKKASPAAGANTSCSDCCPACGDCLK